MVQLARQHPDTSDELAVSSILSRPMEGYSGYYCHRKRFTLVYITTDVTRLLFRLCFSWVTSCFTSASLQSFRRLLNSPSMTELLVPGVPGVVHVHTCTYIASTAVMSFHDPSHPFISYIPEYCILLVHVPRYRYRTPWYPQGYRSTFIMCWHADIDWCQTCLWYMSAFWPVDSCHSSDGSV